MIPVNEPLFQEREKALLCECIDTGWVSSEGKFVSIFEEKVAEFTGTSYGVAVCNGSVALELAVAVLGLKPGDEVILPSFTIISCVHAILRNGLKPVLVDVEGETWNMDINQVEQKITQRTRAIMPVHMYGHPVDMDPLIRLAETYGLYIIEDAAEAQGALYKDKKCGSIGHLGVFSFYANKIVTTGEGGMVITSSEFLNDRLRKMRDLSFEPSQRFYHIDPGFNYRFSNLQAAVGVAQMERIDTLVDRKKQQGEQYRKKLMHMNGITLQVIKEWAEPVYWVNGIVLENEIPFDANQLAQQLKEKGIQTRPFFWPMHEQPLFNKMGLFKNESYPVSERLARRGLYLPSGVALSDEQIDIVCQQLNECSNQKRKAA